MKDIATTLKTSPTRLRASVVRGLEKNESPVDREGGDYGAGLIRGVAVVTRGEALGHGMWLDAAFVEQVAKAAKAQKAGLKARFTHPGLSSDGMGRLLGRIKSARLDGDIVRGDLHLAKSATKTPDGNLAEYVMTLAEEDPEAFGTSIVFESDVGAERDFIQENGGYFELDDDGIEHVVDFVSPDEDNVNGYRHARLAKLYADDIVDEPAANPGGLFHRGDEIAGEADKLLSYALGLTTQKPELTALEIDPDRVAGFVERFMALHGLELKEMSMGSNTKPEDQAKPNDELAAKLEEDEVKEDELEEDEDEKEEPMMSRLAALKKAFPNDAAFVLEQFASGRNVEQAQIEFDRKELTRLKGEVAKLQKSGAKPVAFGGGAETPDGGDFMTQAKALAASKSIPMHQAMSQLAREKPELHRAFVEAQNQ